MRKITWKNAKATWKSMPLWAKVADTAILALAVYGAISIIRK